MTDPNTGLLDCTILTMYVALARKLDTDNPRYHQAMASADSDTFKETIVVGMRALTSKKISRHGHLYLAPCYWAKMFNLVLGHF